MFELAKSRCFYEKTLSEPRFLAIDEIYSACTTYKNFEIKRDCDKKIVKKNDYNPLQNYQKEMYAFIKNISKI